MPPDGLPVTLVFRDTDFSWVDNRNLDDGGYWSGGVGVYESAIIHLDGFLNITHVVSNFEGFVIYFFQYDADGLLSVIPTAQLQVEPFPYSDPGNYPDTFLLGDDLDQFLGPTKPLPEGIPTTLTFYLDERSWPLQFDGRVDITDLSKVRFSYLQGLTTAIYVYLASETSFFDVLIPGLTFNFTNGGAPEVLHSTYETFNGERWFVRSVGDRVPSGDLYEGEPLDYAKDHIGEEFNTDQRPTLGYPQS